MTCEADIDWPVVRSDQDAIIVESVMSDGGDFRVCGGNLVELGKNSGIRDWVL